MSPCLSLSVCLSVRPLLQISMALEYVPLRALDSVLADDRSTAVKPWRLCWLSFIPLHVCWFDFYFFLLLWRNKNSSCYNNIKRISVKSIEAFAEALLNVNSLWAPVIYYNVAALFLLFCTRWYVQCEWRKMNWLRSLCAKLIWVMRVASSCDSHLTWTNVQPACCSLCCCACVSVTKPTVFTVGAPTPSIGTLAQSSFAELKLPIDRTQRVRLACIGMVFYEFLKETHAAPMPPNHVMQFQIRIFRMHPHSALFFSTFSTVCLFPRNFIEIWKCSPSMLTRLSSVYKAYTWWAFERNIFLISEMTMQDRSAQQALRHNKTTPLSTYAMRVYLQSCAHFVARSVEVYNVHDTLTTETITAVCQSHAQHKLITMRPFGCVTANRRPSVSAPMTVDLIDRSIVRSFSSVDRLIAAKQR